MNKFEFEKAMIKLEIAFNPLSKNSDERDKKINAYYNRLKSVDEYVLNKAVIWLQDNYEYRNFPLIADIFKAIYGVKESMQKEYHLGEECDECQGTGWIIRDCTDEVGRARSYTIAAPCRHCSTGRAVRKACAIKDKHLQKRKALRETEAIVKEATESLPDDNLFKGRD